MSFRVRPVEDLNPSYAPVVPLLWQADGQWVSLGSAFFVAPGLAITAAHVVKDWTAEGSDDTVIPVTAVQVIDGVAYSWAVDRVYVEWPSDIAFVVFKKPAWWGDGPSQITTAFPRLNMHPPVPGDVIRAVGYPGSHVDDGVLTVYPSESLTRVREVQIKTPLRIRPTSYVELDGEIRGGMSGGPCFDEAGRVVGICSKGWDFLDDEPDQTPISYMALIWPAMGRRIEHYQREPFPVWDLFRGGPAQAIGHDRIHVTSKGDVHIAKVTEELLLPFHWTFSADQLDASLHYCAENARASVRRGTRTPGRTRMQQAKRQPNSHVLAAVLRRARCRDSACS